MMSERERYKAWAESKGLTPYGKKADHFLMVPFGWEAWDERARIAEQEKRELVEAFRDYADAIEKVPHTHTFWKYRQIISAAVRSQADRLEREAKES